MICASGCLQIHLRLIISVVMQKYFCSVRAWLTFSVSPKAAIDDVDPEKASHLDLTRLVTCTFYSNPAVESVTWYDGPDDQGDHIHTDVMELNAEDKYISTLFLEVIMSNKTVTCVATWVNQNSKNIRNVRSRAAKNAFTFFIYIIEGISVTKGRTI